MDFLHFLVLFSTASILGNSCFTIQKNIERQSCVEKPPPCPRIVSRPEWKARPSKSINYLPKQPVQFAYIHHSDSKNCFNQTDCAKLVRAFQDFHMDTRHWDDIGYSFLIGGDGTVFEGRGWDRIGAHTKGHNSIGLGFCLIGTFMTQLPTTIQVKQTQRLLDCAVGLNKLTSCYVARGHRDVRDTSCPGDDFYKKLTKWPHYLNKPV